MVGKYCEKSRDSSILSECVTVRGCLEIMAKFRVLVYFNLLIIYATTSSLVDGLTLPNQVTPKPRQTKFSLTSPEPGSGSLVTPATSLDSDSGVALYRLVNRKTQSTCILLKTDAVVEVKFKLHNLDEQADSFIPKDAFITGKCENEDAQLLRIMWKGYNLDINFAKTPGGERWYISDIELEVSTDVSQLHGIQTRGKAVKLYHKPMLIPTPVGKSYNCDEVEVELTVDESDHPPKGLRGSLLLRALQVQPFMYKGEDFEAPFECKGQKQFRDETAPIAVGSTLAIAVLMTVTGYGIFRYFKVKNVQYNTME